jgi:hypothetical protein
MPTEIRRPSAPVIGHAGTPKAKSLTISSLDAAPLSITSLTIIAILALVLHVAGGVMLDRSHAGTAMAAPDDETNFVADARTPEPPLPYD